MPSKIALAPGLLAFGLLGRTQSHQSVGRRATADHLDRAQGVVADAGTADRAGRQIDRDAAGRVSIVRPISADAAIKQIVPRPAPQRVVLTAAAEHIVARIAG